MSSGGSSVIVEADGGSRGNPGPAGYGAVVLDAATDEVLAERHEFLGVQTNNVAEYRGLIAGLTAAAELGAAQVRVRMDSKLVVEQMSGRWQVKHPAMRPLVAEAKELAARFERISYEWIPRAQNGAADRLANQAMDHGTGRASAAPAAATTPEATAPAASTTRAKPVGTWLPPSSQPTRIILLRHGVTTHTLARRFAGRSDLALTDRGLEQAELAARRVQQLGGADVIVSSPLRRTRQTAAAVAGRLGLPVITDEGFVETDFGDWDGSTFAEISERWPGELKAWLADPAVAPPSGESFVEVTDRVQRAIDGVLEIYRGKTVLIVSHVTPIKVLVRLALDAPMEALHRMYLEPASLCGIDYFADGNCSLRTFNDTSHLDALD